jgi:chromosome segregation ATPase
MKEQFPAVFALLGVEEMQVSEEGTFFNKDLLATLNANIEAAQKEKADALALVETLTAEKNELTAKVEELTAQAETKDAEHNKAIKDLNAAHATAIEEKDNAIAALEQEKADLQGEVNAKAESIEAMQTELNGAKESLTNAQNTIAERDQQISDLNATIDEMKQEPGEGAQLNGPASNGQGADAPKVVVSRYVYNNDLTYEQNLEAEEKWNKEHGK